MALLLAYGYTMFELAAQRSRAFTQIGMASGPFIADSGMMNKQTPLSLHNSTSQ